MFAFGSEEKGQLGNGSAGERIVSAGKSAFDYETEPSECSHLILRCRNFINTYVVLVKGLADRKIVQISCGPQHAIARDEAGYVLGVLAYRLMGQAELKTIDSAGVYSSGVTTDTAVWDWATRRMCSFRSRFPSSRGRTRSAWLLTSAQARQIRS